MARRQRDASDFDDYTPEGESAPSPAKKSDAVVQPTYEIPVLPGVKTVASDEPVDLKSSDVREIIERQQTVLATTLAVQLDAMKRERASQEETEKIRAWCNLTARERTQLIADQTWGKETAIRWRVSIPNKRAGQIPVVIPANSPEEAEARYFKLCGIRSSEYDVAVEPVTEQGA